MKVWITKYALTNGIEQYDGAEVNVEINVNMITIKTDRYPLHFHGEGKDWHRTEASARARAEVMRKAKIASLRKQIAKLEKLSF
jgi:uncharacterized protein involved in outer membrane biogenesis